MLHLLLSPSTFVPGIIVIIYHSGDAACTCPQAQAASARGGRACFFGNPADKHHADVVHYGVCIAAENEWV